MALFNNLRRWTRPSTRAELTEACKQSVCVSMVANLVFMFIMLRWWPMRPKLLYNERKKRPVRKPLRPRPSRTMLREIWTRPFRHWCSIFHHIFILSLIALQNSRFLKASAWDFCANEGVRRKKRKTFRVSSQSHSLLTCFYPISSLAPGLLFERSSVLLLRKSTDCFVVYSFMLEGWKYKAMFSTFAVSFGKIAQNLLIMVCVPLGE